MNSEIMYIEGRSTVKMKPALKASAGESDHILLALAQHARHTFAQLKSEIEAKFNANYFGDIVLNDYMK